MSRPRLGREIWRDLETEMHATADRIKAADMSGARDCAARVEELAKELKDALANTIRMATEQGN